MTTLSKIRLDPNTRGARKLIGNPQAMHAAVMAAFPSSDQKSEGRPLWRLDSTQGQFALYLSGPGQPELQHIAAQAGFAGDAGQTADLAPFLDRLADGQMWAFRLTANPVMSVSQGEGKRGRVVPHVTAEQQLGWLMAKSTQHGFRLATQEDSLPSDMDRSEHANVDAIVSERKDLKFSKGTSGSSRSRQVSLRTARFDGHLEVTDVQALREAIVNGIGRGRAYGCGLLSLAQQTSA